jgi:hypothetical protein
VTDLDPWAGLAAVEPAALVDATLELHWATQLLAAAGQTFAAPCEDDSHRSMAWDAGLRGFVGACFAGGYPFRLGLRVEDLTLQLIDRTDATLGELELSGETLGDGYTWLRTGLSQYMGGTGPVIERPDFDLPAHPVGEGARFSTDTGTERATLAALYGGAAELLEEVVAGTASASAVRCWPHHFDIATLVRVRAARGGDPARTVGVGMAPMGGGYESWYWYVTPWPYPSAGALPSLRAPAAWHLEEWTGAVLRGSDVVAMPAGERRRRVADFIEEAVGAAKHLLEID